ncbi:MAG: hypothetical protein HY720_20095 [Planctomycetes bacterium]|nr:hypothetical protein [Planctomycetota bacterium]
MPRFLLLFFLAAPAAAQDLVVASAGPDPRLDAAVSAFEAANGLAVEIREGDLAGADVVWTLSPARTAEPVDLWVPAVRGSRALVRHRDRPASDLPRGPLDLAHPRWRDRVGWPDAKGEGALLAALESGERELAVVLAASLRDARRAAPVFFFREDETGVAVVPAAGLLAASRHPDAARLFLESLWADPTGPAPDENRDPFATTPSMTEAARAREKNEEAPPESGPAETSIEVPAIRLKGLIEGEGALPIALLDIEGHGTVFVRAGDTLSLQRGPANVVLVIERISNQSVHVEVGSSGQVIVVR